MKWPTKPSPLCALSTGDKGNTADTVRHNYTRLYHALFGDVRETVAAVFELGIFQGASLRMWRDYFPNATIYGADIDEGAVMSARGDRIVTARVDERDTSAMHKMLDGWPLFDIVIDDALHSFDDNVRVFRQAWERVKPGGFYVIEDLRADEMYLFISWNSGRGAIYDGSDRKVSGEEIPDRFNLGDAQMMTWQESAAWRPEIEGHSIDILPWMVAIESQIPKGGTYVEVGVYKGRSFRFMRELRPDLYMVGIDPHSDESVGPSGGLGDDVRRAFLDVMADASHWVTYRGELPEFPTTMTYDLIFIDGDHSYAGVRDDIAAALRIVKPGGIIAGHDYAGDNGVCQAVREAFPGRYHVSDFDAPLPGAAEGKGRVWWTYA